MCYSSQILFFLKHYLGTSIYHLYQYLKNSQHLKTQSLLHFEQFAILKFTLLGLIMYFIYYTYLCFASHLPTRSHFIKQKLVQLLLNFIALAFTMYLIFSLPIYLMDKNMIQVYYIYLNNYYCSLLCNYLHYKSPCLV